MAENEAHAYAASDDALHRAAARHWIFRRLTPEQQQATRRWREACGIDKPPEQVLTPDDLVELLGYSPEQAREELHTDGLLLEWM